MTTDLQFGRSGLYLYATDAVLFPDEDGGLAVVAAGSGADSVPTIARLTPTCARCGATFHRVDALALLDPRSGPRLLAATTVGGSPRLDPGARTAAKDRGEKASRRRRHPFAVPGPMPNRRTALGLLSTTLLYELN